MTEARVAAALAPIGALELRIGPYTAGALASITASGTLAAPQVTTVDAGRPSFRVTVPATLDLVVRVGVESRVRADVEVDLRLVPRPADPLLLVIDVDPPRTQDVRIAVRGRRLGAAVSGLVGASPAALVDEVRRQVARQVASRIESDALRRARAVDVAARIAGERRGPVPPRWTWLTDDAFGRRFVAHAVTRDRVGRGFAHLAGRPLDIGPMRVGPGGLAEVRATGAIGEPEIVASGDGFVISLPLHLDVVVHLAREHRYDVDVRVLLRATPYPAADLHVVLDVPPVTAADVEVRLTAADALAARLGRAGRIEQQLADHVVRAVNERVAATPGRVVDIGPLVTASR